jgi:hypothetical protein
MLGCEVGLVTLKEALAFGAEFGNNLVLELDFVLGVSWDLSDRLQSSNLCPDELINLLVVSSG